MKDLNDYIEDVQKQISYWFEESELLFQAFTRRSYSEENGGANNEVLEFAGDRVLDYFVTKILMDRFGYQNDIGEFLTEKYKTEGSLTNIKKKLVCKEMLAHRIDKMGFKDYLYMGKGDIKQTKQDETSVKEDLFEAILGAIAIDCNWDPDTLENSVSFMLNIEHYLTHGFNDEDDFVALLQQWNQKENGEVPDYEFNEVWGGGYEAHLYLETQRGRMHYWAKGDSKAEARAAVAEIAYEDLEEHDELFTILDELPEELTSDNAINTLQELAQKGYCSMPEYDMSEDQVYDREGNPLWKCTCFLRSPYMTETSYKSSKKLAKKMAAYKCICNICGLEEEYE